VSLTTLNINRVNSTIKFSVGLAFQIGSDIEGWKESPLQVPWPVVMKHFFTSALEFSLCSRKIK
jgi:hypothetical protein